MPNTWKKAFYGHQITPDTVLEFEYQSNAEGELQGIGFDNDDDINNNDGKLFKLQGTQERMSS